MWRFFIFLLILNIIAEGKLLSQNQSGNKQADKPVRIEIQARSVNETYRTISCGKDGLIMFFRSQEVTPEAKTNWYFTCYDTNFQQRWMNIE